MSEIKPTGTCDICKVKPASYWYGNTSAAICNDNNCRDSIGRKYKSFIEAEEYE